jgi:hypothetical protein
MLGKLFDRQQGSGSASQSAGGPRLTRHSGGWGTLRKQLSKEEGLRVLDIGSTSPANINYLTSLGHSVYMADLVIEANSGEWQTGTDEDGKPIWNIEAFTEQNLKFSGRTFDMVLLWTALDYLPEGLVAPVVAGLHAAMAPGGQLLAVFHTKLQPELAPYHRFHITATDDVELQAGLTVKQQRAMTNRNIERLFTGWPGLKQFLAKDGVSEAIIVR